LNIDTYFTRGKTSLYNSIFNGNQELNISLINNYWNGSFKYYPFCVQLVFHVKLFIKKTWKLCNQLWLSNQYSETYPSDFFFIVETVKIAYFHFTNKVIKVYFNNIPEGHRPMWIYGQCMQVCQQVNIKTN